MVQKDLIVVIDHSAELVSLSELCQACRISPDFIHQLIEYEIIQARRTASAEWMFDLTQVRRVKTFMRLQRDLELNFAGAALVLDMIEEVNELRARVALCERYHRF